jgi:hypothetical protein
MEAPHRPSAELSFQLQHFAGRLKKMPPIKSLEQTSHNPG